MNNRMNHDIITPNEQTRITQDSTVDLHFEVSLENGTVIDSTFERGEPVRLVVGDGSLLEGFEKVLINLTAGDTRTASLSPEEAFGEWNPDNVQTFSHAQFAVTKTKAKPRSWVWSVTSLKTPSKWILTIHWQVKIYYLKCRFLE